MRLVSTPDAPKPAGHYSQGVVHAGVVYVAGQLPLDPATGELVGPGDMTAQAERTFRNVGAVPAAVGSGRDRSRRTPSMRPPGLVVARPTGYGCRVLKSHRPAQAGVPVLEFRHGRRIEIPVVAVAATAG